MTEKKDWRGEFEQLVEKLRDPFKMRMAVALATIAIMCFAINDPIHGRMRYSNRELNELKVRVRTAEEVMLLRDHCAALEGRIIKGKNNDVVVSHLIDIVRREKVELMRIDAQPPERLGPMQSVRVIMDVNGSFDALTQLLYRFDSNQYLIRVENLLISPSQQDPATLRMNVSLQIIKEAV